MKARKVKHLDPAASFGANAARIVAVRTREVLDLASADDEPGFPALRASEIAHQLRKQIQQRGERQHHETLG